MPKLYIMLASRAVKAFPVHSALSHCLLPIPPQSSLRGAPPSPMRVTLTCAPLAENEYEEGTVGLGGISGREETLRQSLLSCSSTTRTAGHSLAPPRPTPARQPAHMFRPRRPSSVIWFGGPTCVSATRPRGAPSNLPQNNPQPR